MGPGETRSGVGRRNARRTKDVAKLREKAGATAARRAAAMTERCKNMACGGCDEDRQARKA